MRPRVQSILAVALVALFSCPPVATATSPCQSVDLSRLEWQASLNEDRNPNPVDNFAELTQGSSAGEIWYGMIWDSPEVPELGIDAINHHSILGAQKLLLQLSASSEMEVDVWIGVTGGKYCGREWRYAMPNAPLIVGAQVNEYEFAPSDFSRDPSNVCSGALPEDAFENLYSIVLFPKVRSGELRVHSISYSVDWLEAPASDELSPHWLDDINVLVGQTSDPALLELNPTALGWANNYVDGWQCSLLSWARVNAMRFVSSLSFWEDNTTTAVDDLPPELRGATCIDIDGNTLFKGEPDQSLVWMNTNSPAWQDWMRAFAFDEVDRGVDGFVLDEYMGNANTLWHGGTFDAQSTAGFRDYLAVRYTEQYLLSEYGIVDLAAFDYRQFLLSRNLRSLYLTSPWRCPLFGDFLTFQEQSAFSFTRELVTDITAYAERQGQEVSISANAYQMGSGNLWTAGFVDYLTFEHQYLWPEGITLEGTELLPPQWKAGPLIKLSAAITDHRPVVMATIPDLFLLGDLGRETAHDLLNLFIAEAYATGGAFLHFNIDAFEADSSWVAPTFDLFRAHADILRDCRPFSKIAVLYSHPTVTQYGSFGFRGACMLLSDLVVQYDVLFAGFGAENQSYNSLDRDIALQELERYEKLILPGDGLLTDRQVDLILEYMENGGHVIAWDAFGISPGELDPIEMPTDRPELQRLLVEGTHPVGEGLLTYYPGRDIGLQYYQLPSSAGRTLVGRALVESGFSPIVSIDDPTGVNAYSTLANNRKTLVVCLVNENMDPTAGRIEPRENLAVSVELPEGIDMKRVRVRVSLPGEETTTLGVDLASMDGILTFTVPRLPICSLVVIDLCSEGL